MRGYEAWGVRNILRPHNVCGLPLLNNAMCILKLGHDNNTHELRWVAGTQMKGPGSQEVDYYLVTDGYQRSFRVGSHEESIWLRDLLIKHASD